MKDLIISRPKDVSAQTRVMMTRDMPKEMSSWALMLRDVMAATLLTKTLLAKKKVIVTETRSRKLDHPFWGDLDMNCASFRHTSRHKVKNGSRHPLKICAIAMILVRSAVM